MTSSRKDQGKAVGVLVSGGVESAALLSEALRRYQRVYPIYVRKGLKWEEAELSSLKGLLKAVQTDPLAKLTILDVPVAEIYAHHWSVTQSGTPSFKAPDAAVYLPGRNLLLLGLGGLFCSLRRVPVLWIGILKGNPFHDARTGFVQQMQGLLAEATGFPLRIAAPFRELTKAQVVRRWPDLPWAKTFSCLNPAGPRHCGRCQKCAERKTGFQESGIPDPTRYAKS